VAAAVPSECLCLKPVNNSPFEEIDVAVNGKTSGSDLSGILGLSIAQVLRVPECLSS
jgi:hypothetical protein